MNNASLDRRFPHRALLSAALSLLSLCAYVFLLRPGDHLPLIKYFLILVWLVGAGAGVLVFIGSRGHEPRVPVGMAGLLAVATGFTLFAFLICGLP
jgi:hypothetical protein